MSSPGVPVRAVVFDLWLTLIPFPSEVRREAFSRTAEALGLRPDELRPHWDATRIERETTDLRAYLRRLGNRLARDGRAAWSEDTIDAAVEARSSSHGACFADPFPDGRDAIAALRAGGLKVALVSNCTSDVRPALTTHGMDEWFDCLILSAEVGVMKPAPEIYALAARSLEVEPHECLYTGDGSDHELEGAAEAGMTPILYDRTAPQPSPTGSTSTQPTSTQPTPDGSTAARPAATTAAAVETVSSHLELIRYLDR